jgi:hypothetical protein
VYIYKERRGGAEVEEEGGKEEGARGTYPYLFSSSFTLLTVRVGLSVMHSLLISHGLQEKCNKGMEYKREGHT